MTANLLERAVLVFLGAWILAAAGAPPGAAIDRSEIADRIDAMVHDLLSNESARRQLGVAAGPVVLDGVAWEYEPGRIAGTSALGVQLRAGFDRALTQRGITVSDSLVRTRGIAGTLIKGAFRVVGGTVRVALSMVDANSGRIVSQAVQTLRETDLVGLGIDQILPPGSEDAKLLAQLLGGVLGSESQPFAITLRTRRGTQAAYFEGEPLQVLIESERDCYLRLYHISWTDKRLTLIFPNRSEPVGFMTGGTVIQVPAEGSGAIFEVGRPYGVDAIVAVASESPFDDESLVRSTLETGEAAENSAGNAADAESDASGTDDAGDTGPERVGDFLSEGTVDGARAQAVLTRGLFVRHEPTTGGDATAAGGTTALQSPGLPDRSRQVAHAVCYFTSLPRIAFSR